MQTAVSATERSRSEALRPLEQMVARDNRAFFLSVVAPEASSGGLADAVFAALQQPHEFDAGREPYHAHFVVNAAGLNRDRDSFVDDLARAICRIARNMSDGSFVGNLNDRMMLQEGPFRFDFHITGYWAGKSPDGGMVEDPVELYRRPPGDTLSRQVELKVSLIDVNVD